MGIPTKPKSTVSKGMRRKMRELGIKQKRPIDSAALRVMENELFKGRMIGGKKQETIEVLRKYYARASKGAKVSLKELCNAYGIESINNFEKARERLMKIPNKSKRAAAIGNLDILQFRIEELERKKSMLKAL